MAVTMYKMRLGVLLVGTALLATQAMAGTTTMVGFSSGGPVASTSGLGTYEGKFTYDDDAGGGIGKLTVELTNTSPAANKGYITSFGFNINGNATASNLTSTSSTFKKQITGAGAPPFGIFEVAMTTTGGFNGGGAASKGIGVGQTVTFMFDISGPDAGSLTAIDFATELSTGTQPSKSIPILARFRGFRGGGSDKVPGTHVVPLPAGVWMGMSLLGGLGVIKARRKA